MKKLTYEIEDRIHLMPAAEIYRELVEAYKNTGSTIITRIYHKPEIKSEVAISGESGQSISFIGEIIAAEPGELVEISFEASGSKKHIYELEKRIDDIISRNKDNPSL